MNVAQADRAAAPWRVGGAGDTTHLAPVRDEERTAIDRHVGSGIGHLRGETDQPSRHAALAPVADSHDHLLPDVATLREADGSLLESGLERMVSSFMSIPKTGRPASTRSTFQSVWSIGTLPRAPAPR